MTNPPGATAQPRPRPAARCRDCGYVVDGLTSGTCPECGRPFDLSDPITFSFKPPLVRSIFYIPWIAVVMVGMCIGVGVMMFAGHWGWGAWFAVPFAGGSLLGYTVRAKWFFIVVLCLTGAISIPLGLATADASGLFCGLMLVGVVLGPLTAGVAAATLTRLALKHTGFPQRGHLPMLIIGLAPLTVALVQGPADPYGVATISTVQTVAAPPARIWPYLEFFEHTNDRPPLLLRLGLPEPVGTRGSIANVGDRTTCIYDRGYLVKEITHVDPGHALAFDVVEQRIHFEHDVELLSGRFQLDETSDGSTKMTLETTYRPLVGPRWVWAPVERLAVHTLHRHVVDSISVHAEMRPDTGAPYASASSRNGRP